MKKSIVIVLVAFIAAACNSPTTNREVKVTNANSAAKAAAPLTEADATMKEKQIWESLQKKNYDAFASMLDPDFVLVESEAVDDKAGTVKGVTGFVPADVTFSDWKYVPIDKDAGVILYTTKFKGTSNGKAIPEQHLYCSSAWVNRNGKWLGIYHQETAVQPPPPTPASNKTPASSPAAKSAAQVATSSDAIANEKAVWEALKAKQIDVFASFLASNFMEIEAYGVTDRANTIKITPTFDLSKASLSDWKSVRLGDNAALVTYTVKLPNQKPDTERHSTIWANQGGKWSAVFHQGTPVLPAPPQKPMAKP